MTRLPHSRFPLAFFVISLVVVGLLWYFNHDEWGLPELALQWFAWCGGGAVVALMFARATSKA